MRIELKNYITYFFKSNRRLLLLEFLVLFVFIPFLTYNQIELGIEEAQLKNNLLSVSNIMIILCTLVLAFIMPIYVYRFIFKRESSDLYFALPIKRRTLFTIQFLLGTLLALIPLGANCLLEALIIGWSVKVDILTLLLFFLIDVGAFLILYALVSFLVVKCNTLLDAILIAGAYMVMPLFIFIASMVFLNGQGDLIYVSNNNITGEILGSMGLEFILGMLSLPAALSYGTLFSIQENWITNSFMLSLIIYWVCIGFLCFYLAQRTFIRRKEEDAQQRTNAIPTYPFIITLFVVCMMLLSFSYDMWSSSMISTLIIIFILYVVMQMFAKRSLRLRLKDFLLFAIILVATYSFILLFQSTSGLGLLHEVPAISNIETVVINYYDKGEEYTTVSDANDRDIVVYHEDGSKNIAECKDKDSIKSVLAIQEEFIKTNKKHNAVLESTNIGEIRIQYNLKNGNELYRFYEVYTVDEKRVQEKIKALNEK